MPTIDIRNWDNKEVGSVDLLEEIVGEIRDEYDVEAESRRLSEAGLQQIPIDGLKSASFFYPRSAMGILTELVPVRTLTRVHSTA